MQGIIDTITAIGEFIMSLVDFVISFIGDLLYIIEVTGQFLAQIPSYFSWLPSPAVALIVTIFGIVVIYKISGREG